VNRPETSQPVPLPDGAVAAYDWDGGDPPQRTISGEPVTVPDSTYQGDILVTPLATQQNDGTMATAGVVAIDEVHNVIPAGLLVEFGAVRALAAALIKAADVLDGWAEEDNPW
jgi:hypothetical protein